MATPEELKEKYPLMHHAPDPNCERCKGEGEFWHESSETFLAGFMPCMCIFVDHDFAPEARAALSKTAKKLRAELDKERDIARVQAESHNYGHGEY